MNRLQISIREVENGYVIFDDFDHQGYSGRQWVAETIGELRRVVEERAAECLPEKGTVERSRGPSKESE